MQTFKKKFFLFVFIFFLSFFSFVASAQVPPDIYQQVHPDIHLDAQGSRVDCERVTLQGTNYISNNEFKHDALSNVTDPFPSGQIPYWVETYGSPALSDFLTPPSNAPGGIYGYASIYSWIGNEKDVLGEGIAQVIPATVPDKQYSLSFFKKLAGNTKDIKSNMDKFYIVLLHCGDYERIHKYPLYEIPRIPNDVQIIYSESNLNNPDWMQIQSAFTAKGEYDMVWIFPVQGNNVKDLLAVDFTGMILKEAYIDGDFHCDQPLPLVGCNHIPNPGFTLNVPMTPFLIGAFSQNWVTDWNDSHGTCDINREVSLPPLFLGNYASMAVVSSFLNGQQLYSNEGIAAKIKPVQQGRRYALSFFVATNFFQNPVQNAGFNIALIQCQNFPNASSSYNLPPLSIPNQPIYCESVALANNTGWKRVFVSFTATGDYDMIRIYPDQTQPGFDNSSFFNLSYPELIDITDFSSGPTPVPNPSTCHVIIGPDAAPVCSVVGTSFTWHGPNGLTVGPLFTDLQYEIDASDPLNVGTWTLTMDVPNAVQTNNSCSENIISVSVNVPPCGEVWPKIYYNDIRLTTSLLKDANSNFFVAYTGFAVNSPQGINHIGPFPSTVATSDNLLVHYTANGITNWYKETIPSSIQNFVLNSGEIRIGNNNAGLGIYQNCVTGIPTSGPGTTLVPTNEAIIAEASGGRYITAGVGTINVHSGSGSTSTIVSGKSVRFNPVSNKLFVIDYQTPQSPNTLFYVYQLTGNSLSLISNSTIAGSYDVQQLVLVDNQDKVYFVKNDMLQEYSYTLSTPVFTPISISNFTNSDIRVFFSDNIYTEDRVLVMNTTEENIYSIDFSAAAFAKKIHTTNVNLSSLPYPMVNYRYVYDADNLYISGETKYGGPDLSIGNQTIPALGPNLRSVFFTKFNLQTDFNFKQGYLDQLARSNNNSLQNSADEKEPGARIQINIALSPNPVKDILQVNVLNAKTSRYNITIINSQGRVVWQQRMDQKTANIPFSGLDTGIYYTKISDSEGNASTGTFVKL